ncbi:YgjV family protein [Paraferrimonas haliotis]|nr:YgjV family protein [Paraferrimonas haliotis]
MSPFLLSQLLVLVTIVLECVAMQLKRPNRLLLLLSISCLFNGFHFYLLEQPTAAYIFWFSSLRFLICARWKYSWLAYVSIAISSAICMATFIGVLSLIGLLGTVLMTLGSFHKDDQTMRLLMTSGSFIWLVHNVMLGTPLGMVLELIFVVSGVIGWYRLHCKPFVH